jgi:hypothetical protein
VWAVNRRVVCASISGFSQGGPYADRGRRPDRRGLGGAHRHHQAPGFRTVAEWGCGLRHRPAPLLTGRACAHRAIAPVQGVGAPRCSGDGEPWTQAALAHRRRGAGTGGNQHPTMVPMKHPTADGYRNVSARATSEARSARSSGTTWLAIATPTSPALAPGGLDAAPYGCSAPARRPNGGRLWVVPRDRCSPSTRCSPTTRWSTCT